MPLGLIQSTRSMDSCPSPLPLYLIHMDTALMTPNYTVIKSLMSLCSSWRICMLCLSGLYLTNCLFQAHTAHANPTGNASLGQCNFFPLTWRSPASIPFWNVNMHQSCAHSSICISCSVFTTIHYRLRQYLSFIYAHLSDSLCLVPHINNLRTVSFNVSATQFQFNPPFSLRVRIILLKLT